MQLFPNARSLDILKSARRRESSARADYHALIERHLRPGVRVFVSRGRASFPADVTELPYAKGQCTSGERVWVTGQGGKSYWVHAYRIDAIVVEGNAK